MRTSLAWRRPDWAWVLSPAAWSRDGACYMAYRVADYVVQNLGEDAAMVALAFC